MYALTSLLVRDQVVPVRKIEEALQRQVVSGGEIETVLLELAAVSENVLAAYAAATLGVRSATRDEVMQAPREVVRIVPREVAEKHHLVPIGVDGRILYVAVTELLTPEVDQQLGFLLGFELVPRVVTAVRLAAGLAQHYGIEPLPRHARLAEKLKERDAGEVPFVAPLASRTAEQYLPSERRRVGFSAFDDEDEDEGEGEGDESRPVTLSSARPAAQWSTPATKPAAERVAHVSGVGFEDSVARATKPFGFAVVEERPSRPERPRPATWSGAAVAPEIRSEPPPPPVSAEAPLIADETPAALPSEAAQAPEAEETLEDARAPEAEETLEASSTTAESTAATLPGARFPETTLPGATPPEATPFEGAQPEATLAEEAQARADEEAGRTEIAPPEPVAPAVSSVPLSTPPVAPSWRPNPSTRPTPAGVNTLLVALGAPTAPAPAQPTAARIQPASVPRSTATPGERRASGFMARLRGPLALRTAAELLGEAETRNEVLATFFAFARQSFDYAALFVVQDDVAEGREASGPGATTAEVERIAISLDAGGGLFAEVRHDGVGRIASLAGSERDQTIAARLKRPASVPCAVLPLTIRRRVVLVLYGDRNGVPLTLDELPELLGVMPRVSEAFERLILRRKFTHATPPPHQAQATEDAPVRPHAAEPPSAAAPEPDTTAARAPGAATAPEPRSAPPLAVVVPQIVPAREMRALSGALSVLAVPRSAPPPPRPRRPGTGTPEPFAALVAAAVPSVPAAPPVADDDDDVVVEMTASTDDDDDDLEDFEDAPDAATEPEMLLESEAPAEPTRPSNPPPRMDGSYSVQDATEEVFTSKPRRTQRSVPPSASTTRPSQPPPRAHASQPGAHVTPAASPASSGRVSKDTRPESPFSRDKRKPDDLRDEPSVIVDMGENVEGMIQELISTAPDEDDGVIARLLRVGDAALPALVQHFPGPLWFDRRNAHARLPRGRDVSAIARALVAFRERATPYLPSLLDGKDADARFYTTLLASEIVHGGLLEALGRRVFDEDAGTRLLALDVLKRYQHLPEYASTLETIRAIARNLHRDVARRRIAIRALAELRDARAVPMLITVLDDEDDGVRGEAQRALVTLTKQDFGDQRKRWEQWAEKHGQAHRVEWLIDALLHNDEPVRAAAGEELKRLTQEYYGYHPGSPRRERERVHGKYLQWWDSEGKAKF